MKNEISIPGEVFNSQRFENARSELQLDERCLPDYLVKIAEAGLPTDRNWIVSMGKEDNFQNYLVNACDDYLSKSAFVPRSERNEVRERYVDVFENCKHSVSSAAAILKKNYVFVENGIEPISIDVKNTLDQIRADCYDIVDTDRLQKMAVATRAIETAIKEFSQAAQEAQLPDPFNGGVIVSSPYGGGTIYAEDFLRQLINGEADGEKLGGFVSFVWRIYTCKPKTKN